MATAKTKEPSEFDNAHHILVAALKVTPPELHPKRPFHGGGPQPDVDAKSYVVAALWLADRLDAMVEPRDREAFDAWIALARRQLARGQKDTTEQARLFEASAARVSRVPLKVAIWSAQEASNWAFRPIYAGGAARPSAGQVAKLLLQKGTPEDVRAYLVELDAFAVHMEALAGMHERDLAPTSPVRRTLWRGHAEGKATHWLMELESGAYALLAKLGRRWSITEGTRDEVLATVSDAQFETAARAVLGRR